MQARKKQIVLILTLLIVSGCVSNSPNKVEKVYIEKPALDLDIPETPKINEVSFTVLTSNNSNSKFLELTDSGKLPTLICVTPKNYENISLNTQALENHIKELEKIVIEYKKYYETER
jgi:hypothetical protein